MKKMILKTEPAWCKGCGICVEFCPRDALELAGEKVRLKAEDQCGLCGLCEMRCPDYAIYLAEEGD
jgi:2-oxoglutarate ferredoxin oxidoreductase subunit delta